MHLPLDRTKDTWCFPRPTEKRSNALDSVSQATLIRAFTTNFPMVQAAIHTVHRKLSDARDALMEFVSAANFAGSLPQAIEYFVKLNAEAV